MEKEFKHNGLDCKVLQTDLGHFCGYVAVPKEHPWYGCHYDDEVSVPQKIIDRAIDIDKVGVINLFCLSEAPTTERCPIVFAIDIHGGLTFANKFKDDERYWFGFDCAHAGDSPAVQDAAYVEKECRALAEQLAAFQTATT